MAKRGRPYNSFRFGEPSVLKTHRLTARAHKWVLENKRWIEAALYKGMDISFSRFVNTLKDEGYTPKIPRKKKS